jgi:Helix-turn-helix domain
VSIRATAYIAEMTVCPKGESLTMSEKLVAMVLGNLHQDRDDARTFPSVETIATKSLISVRMCQRILASLERKGVIVRVRPAVQYRGVTTFYRFPELDAETAEASGRVKRIAPLEPDKGETQFTLKPPKDETQFTLKPHLRVTEGCQKGDIRRTASNNTVTKNKYIECFVLPDWIPREAWDGYEEMRRKKKKVPTDRARRLAVKELESLRAAGHDPAAVLDQSTYNNWTGLFPVKQNGSDGHAQKAAEQTAYQDANTLYDGLKSAPRRPA